MADSKPRKRSRAACLSCQSRKRKCSGEQPCATCVQSSVDCQYSSAPRKKRRSTSAYRATLPSLHESQQPPDGLAYPIPVPTVSTAGSAASPGSFNRVGDSGGVGHAAHPYPQSQSQSLEVNSGAAFVRKLGLRIDPARAPRLHLFGWNVGERRKASQFSVDDVNAMAMMSSSSPPSLLTPKPPTSIAYIVNLAEMRKLATIYFEKVDPCYSFLDRGYVFSRITQRYDENQRDIPEQPYDAVLHGVAAFGYLFSRLDIVGSETRSVDEAHRILQESVLGAETPSIDIIAGWVLRTAYLRMTASPHAGWMASCTLMHLIEAAGLHLESTDSDSTSLLPRPPSQTAQSRNNNSETPNTPDTRRRLFGMARHLNTWISFDLGRSRVVLHGATTQSAPQPPNRADLLQLLPLSESLDPTTSAPQDLPDLETALVSVLDIVYTEPSLILVQCNLMLCIYRRVRALNAHAPLSTRLDRVLALASRGLRAAREVVASTCPWHQVANVPFQVVCTLLAIDNRAALALLPDAMQTLREVGTAYDTEVMREAYSTAYLLVAMHQRRKEDDTRALADVLRANSAAAAVVGQQDVSRGQDGVVEGSGLERKDSGQEEETVVQQGVGPISTAPVSDVELSWLGDLVIDMPSLQNFDLDQFLMTDVPWPLPEMGI
ncbi:hypothetical protein N7454_006103 [Penicillium verhagenii]|nr:hypothetical protein N7454_006103 [Penicillium verhagenii]